MIMETKYSYRFSDGSIASYVFKDGVFYHFEVDGEPQQIATCWNNTKESSETVQTFLEACGFIKSA